MDDSFGLAVVEDDADGSISGYEGDNRDSTLSAGGGGFKIGTANGLDTSSLADVRYFIDGMYYYILKKHGVTLINMQLPDEERVFSSNDYSFEAASSAIHSTSHSHSAWDSSVSSSSTAGLQSNHLHSLVTATSIAVATATASSQDDDFRMRNSVFNKQYLSEVDHVDSEMLTVITFLIYTIVEEATFLPLREHIFSYFQSYYSSVSHPIAHNLCLC